MSVSGLSAHADRDELLRWSRSAESLPRAVFVVHGEPESAQALARRLRRDDGLRCWVPRLDDSHELAEILAP
jgi:metallo-beta-lactamase family protein